MKNNISIAEALTLAITLFGWESKVETHCLEPLQGADRVTVPERFETFIEHSVIGINYMLFFFGGEQG